MVKIGEDFYSDNILASPAVRDYASSKGVNINLVKGTAQNGRILKEDVDAFVSSGRVGKALAAPNVRGYAKEKGVDISKVIGSGKDGRVLLEDIDSYLKGPSKDSCPLAENKTKASKAQEQGATSAEYTIYKFNQVE